MKKQGSVLRIWLLCVAVMGMGARCHAKRDTLGKINAFKNSIVLSGVDFSNRPFMRSFFFDRGFLKPLFIWRNDQVGIHYYRKLEHVRVGGGFNTWNFWPLYNLNGKDGVRLARGNKVEAGKVVSGGLYRMVDGYASYEHLFGRRHKVNVGLGLSYTWGRNTVCDSVVLWPGGYDATVYVHEEKEKYFGIVPVICYDLLFLKGRWSGGCDVRYRKYFGFFHENVEAGFHIGFNF